MACFCKDGYYEEAQNDAAVKAKGCKREILHLLLQSCDSIINFIFSLAGCKLDDPCGKNTICIDSTLGEPTCHCEEGHYEETAGDAKVKTKGCEGQIDTLKRNI